MGLHLGPTPAVDWSARMSELAERFHVLRGRPGVRPWDTVALIRSLRRDDWTPASADAACFVLAVWNENLATDKPALRFDAVRAMARWDAGNRDAFLSWVREPFFP